MLLVPLTGTSQVGGESSLKFALYSPSWGAESGLNLLAGLHLVVDNQTGTPIRLVDLEFQSDIATRESQRIRIDLDIAANSLAEVDLPYTDLLAINQCATATLNSNWRLVEISNYTLNPSVRRLIIQDTSAFRIYQCISEVRTHWINTSSSEEKVHSEWVLYHFENRPNG
ncbi:MAG: hypothetical protein R3F41_04145 [Gammaproteobacteria bacterium]|nr:hypothetical protein [Pseudomonadales bacterium]MCP5345516.1 hypothetical protein [Pseudomonadales bacterium]